MNKILKSMTIVYAFVALFCMIWCLAHRDAEGGLLFLMCFTSLSVVICIDHEVNVTKQHLAELIDIVKDLSDIMKEEEERKLAELQKDVADD